MIGSHDVLGIGKGLRAQKANEGFSLIRLTETRLDLIDACWSFSLFAGGNTHGRKDASIHRNQVRRELNHGGRLSRQTDLLFYFRQMPVKGHPIGANAFIAFDEEKWNVSLATCTADPTQGIGHKGRRLNQSIANQWQGRKKDAGRIASGRSDQLGGSNGFTTPLGQSINRLAEKLWCRVLGTIKFTIDLRVPNTKVGTQVNDLAAARNQRLGKFCSHSVRKCQKGYFSSPKDRGSIRCLKAKVASPGQTGKARKDLSQRTSIVLAGGQNSELNMRMQQQQLDQLFSGITGSSNDGHLDLGGWIHRIHGSYPITFPKVNPDPL